MKLDQGPICGDERRITGNDRGMTENGSEWQGIENTIDLMGSKRV